MDVVKKNPSDWTANDIANFWDWQSKNRSAQYSYFTSSLAPGLVKFLKSENFLKGNVLDYGCGTGYLLEQMLMNANVNFYGIDFSEESIAAAKARTTNKPNLKQLVVADTLPSNFTDEQFDLITLIETIEHLPDDSLHETMQELFRLLKKGGKVFITTPFSENLHEHMVFCPFCKTEFHGMQHVQSFTVDSLAALGARYGFQVQRCVNIDIEKFKLGRIKFFIKSLLKKLAIAAGLKDAVLQSKPNLIAIFVKP